MRLCSKGYTSAQNRTTFISLTSETLPLTLPQFTTSPFCDKYLNVVLTDKIYRSEQFEKVLTHCKFSNRPLAVYLYLQSGNRTDLTNLLHKDLHKIHVLSTHVASESFIRKVMYCPHLSHLSIVGLFDKSVFVVLNKAVECGNLPQLRHLSFSGAFRVSDLESLPTLFHPDLPSLRYLNLYNCQLSSNDIRALFSLETTSPLRYLTCLTMNWFTKASEELLMKVLRQNNLTELNLSMPLWEICCIKDFKPQFFAKLKILRLEKCINSAEELEHLSDIVNSLKLQILDISHSSGITGSVCTLLEQHFPCLNTLVLSNCQLNLEDLPALAKADVEGRLPELYNLDISQNVEDVDNLFSSGCKWENLVSLDIRYDFGLGDSLNGLEAFVKLGCLCSLQNLRFYVDAAKKVFTELSGTKWPNLRTLEIVSTLRDIEYALKYAKDLIKTDCYPSLRTVCVVVKPNAASLFERDQDTLDMHWASFVTRVRRGQAQNAQFREIDDKKYAEALYALKSLGVEVHVWFSGDEQFTKKAGVM